ncbi:hypothetical protein E3P99_02571 [Wallemia hederae]|uniref:Uncharacterized protein n=1 Tax=Wallemia hederae TaxID=1540922 RepID=A0A4T0FIY9_9BASI|nr:hypothetical protein E3P99_02571 [Wallemia hederae]
MSINSDRKRPPPLLLNNAAPSHTTAHATRYPQLYADDFKSLKSPRDSEYDDSASSLFDASSGAYASTPPSLTNTPPSITASLRPEKGEYKAANETKLADLIVVGEGDSFGVQTEKEREREKENSSGAPPPTPEPAHTSPPLAVPPKLTQASPSVERLYYIPPPTPPKFRSTSTPVLHPMSPGNTHRTPRALKSARTTELMNNDSRIEEVPEEEQVEESDDSDDGDDDGPRSPTPASSRNNSNDTARRPSLGAANNVNMVKFKELGLQEGEPKSAFDDSSFEDRQDTFASRQRMPSFWEKMRMSRECLMRFDRITLTLTPDILSPSASANITDNTDNSSDSASHVSIHVFDSDLHDIDNMQGASSQSVARALATLPSDAIKSVKDVPDLGLERKPFLARIFDSESSSAASNCFFLGFVFGPAVWLIGGWTLDVCDGSAVQRVKADDRRRDWASEWNEISLAFKIREGERRTHDKEKMLMSEKATHKKTGSSGSASFARSDSGAAMEAHPSQSSLAASWGYQGHTNNPPLTNHLFNQGVKPRKFVSSDPDLSILPPLTRDNPDRWVLRCRIAALVSVPLCIGCMIAAIVGIVVSF